MAGGGCSGSSTSTCASPHRRAPEQGPDTTHIDSMRSVPTALVAAASLIVAYAIAVSTGSRPLGGVVLALGGVWCIQAWRRRNGTRTAAILGCVGLAAFVFSHVLALAIGAWPSVLLVSAGMAAVVWREVDVRVSAPSSGVRPR